MDTVKFQTLDGNEKIWNEIKAIATIKKAKESVEGQIYYVPLGC